MSIIGSVFHSIAAGIAHLLHPDKPREYFATVQRTKIPIEEVYACLDAAAEGTRLEGWRKRKSIVDLMKLANPDNPDEAASKANRKLLADEFGWNDPANHNEGAFSGTAEQNEWLFDKVIDDIQNGGLPLPKAEDLA